MRRLVLGLVALGWIGCGAQAPSEPTAAAPVAAAAAPNVARGEGDEAARPNFDTCASVEDNRGCLRGDLCTARGGTAISGACTLPRVCCLLPDTP